MNLQHKILRVYLRAGVAGLAYDMPGAVAAHIRRMERTRREVARW